MNELARLQKRRKVFLRMANRARHDRVWRFYAQEVYRCDEDISRLRQRLMRMVVTVNVLVLVTILASSCNTLSGAGKDITALSDGFMEQMAKE